MAGLEDLKRTLGEAEEILKGVDLEDLPAVGPLLQKLEELEGLAEGGEAKAFAKALRSVLEKAVLEEIHTQRARKILEEGLKAFRDRLEGKSLPDALLGELRAMGVLPEEVGTEVPPGGTPEDLGQLLDALSLRFLTVDLEDLPAMGEVLKDLEGLVEALPEGEGQELASLAKRALERAVLEELDKERASAFVSAVLRALQGALLGEPFPPTLREEAIELGLLEPEPAPEEEEDWKGLLAENLKRAQDLLFRAASADPGPETIQELRQAFGEMGRALSRFYKEGEELCEAAGGLLAAHRGKESPPPKVLDLLAEAVDILKKVALMIQQGEGEDLSPLIRRWLEEAREIQLPKKKLLGEVLVEQGILSEEDLREVLEEQRLRPDKKFGEILLEKGKVSTRDVLRALREQREGAGTVAVEFRKLSHLTDLVGELTVLQAIIRSNPTFLAIRDLKFLQEFEELSRITSELQKTVMSMRMEGLGPTFDRLATFVDQLAREVGKEVRLEAQHNEAEVEAEVISPLYEVLTRILRAVVEDSIEPPEERLRKGKPAEAAISITAERKTSHVDLTIEEDGRGLKEELPLLQEARRILDALQGLLTIRPLEGKAAYVVRVPLGLVVLDGLLSKVAGQWFIIPAHAVREILLPKDHQVVTVSGAGKALKVRKELIPMVDLRRLFALGGNGRGISGLTAVIVELGGRKFALLVEEVIGKQEVVVKALGKALRRVRGIVGGTILGDGSVGLILEPEELLRSEEGT